MQDTQLQHHVQRQVAQFCERVSQALTPLESSSHRSVSDAALGSGLLYVSSAIDIATGPFPGINLLDMLVFLRLCREALERYWIPTIYGDQGRDVAAVFSRSEKDLWEVAAPLIDESQRREFESLIDGWLADNPEQYRVEGVRLDDFADRAGKAARGHAERARGLLSSVRSATQAADQAVLLAERGMFLVNRMPFLLRLQVRLATREVVSDIVARLLAAPAALGNLAARGVAQLRERIQAALTQAMMSARG